MSEELKPCPLCNRKVLINVNESIIWCSCGIEFQAGALEARNLWNTRAEQPETSNGPKQDKESEIDKLFDNLIFITEKMEEAEKVYRKAKEKIESQSANGLDLNRLARLDSQLNEVLIFVKELVAENKNLKDKFGQKRVSREEIKKAINNCWIPIDSNESDKETVVEELTQAIIDLLEGKEKQ